MRVTIADRQGEVKELARQLRTEGHHVALSDAADLAELAIEEGSHLVVLATELLPRAELFDLCRALRRQGVLLLLLLSSADPATLGTQALETGADAFVVRPIAADTLAAYVHALLRRHSLSILGQGMESLRVTEELSLDLAGQRLLSDQREIPLSDREFRLLVYLVQHEGVVLTREALLNAIWGYDYVGTTREIDVYVRYLRQKLEPIPSYPRYLLTSWGRGYQYRGPRRLAQVLELSSSIHGAPGKRVRGDSEQPSNIIPTPLHHDRLRRPST